MEEGWRGACEDLETLYLECAYRDAEGRVEKYKRVAVRAGFHTLVVEVPEYTNAHRP